MSTELLCRCGHLSSDHETLAVWNVDQLTEFGSPCNRCQSDPAKLERMAQGMFCKGFEEWPIDEIPYPGSYAAIVIGCVCPISVNTRRAAEKLEPVYEPTCTVHEWVCQRRELCTHSVGDPTFETETYSRAVEHRRPHTRCEHCTIPLIECHICARQWSDWRISPERASWKPYVVVEKRRSVGATTMLLGKADNVWRCDTCLSSE